MNSPALKHERMQDHGEGITDETEVEAGEWIAIVGDWGVLITKSSPCLKIKRQQNTIQFGH